MTSRLAILILSCDKYSDLWPVFFHYFFSSWPDCPYKIYLLSNFLEYEDSRVKMITIGEDESWSDNLIKTINEIPEQRVMFFLEDAFLTRRVDSDGFEKMLSWCFQEDAEYFRLRPAPKPDIKYNRDIGLISKGAMWRTSLFLSIWKKDILLEILKPGESAWEFEIEGTKRSRDFHKFYSVKKPIFRYLHGVEKGSWILSSYIKILLTQNNILIDALNKRPRMTVKKYVLYLYSNSKGRILALFPMKYRQSIIDMKNRFVGKI